MQAAAIVLALAALGGLTLAVIRFRGAPYPQMWMALGHGLVAATGLGLLIYAAINPGLPEKGQIALGILILAALGGATMFLAFHMKRRPLPIPFVVGHGLLAAAGYLLLLATYFNWIT